MTIHQKRRRLGAENGPSESCKKKPWQSRGKATELAWTASCILCLRGRQFAADAIGCIL